MAAAIAYARCRALTSAAVANAALSLGRTGGVRLRMVVAAGSARQLMVESAKPNPDKEQPSLVTAPVELDASYRGPFRILLPRSLSSAAYTGGSAALRALQ